MLKYLLLAVLLVGCGKAEEPIKSETTITSLPGEIAIDIAQGTIRETLLNPITLPVAPSTWQVNATDFDPIVHVSIVRNSCTWDAQCAGGSVRVTEDTCRNFSDSILDSFERREQLEHLLYLSTKMINVSEEKQTFDEYRKTVIEFRETVEALQPVK